MIFDAHMHVGEFPLFDVSLDREGLEALMREHDYGGGVVFHPDNAHAAEVVEAVDGAWGLFWANPRMPGFLDEARAYLDHPRFLGVKLHPLLDGYHPNDPMVHPIIELLVERGLPVLIHCGHPIFTLPWSIEEAAVGLSRSSRSILGHMGHGNIVYINALDRRGRAAIPTSTSRRRACRCTPRSARRSSAWAPTGCCTARMRRSITPRWRFRRCSVSGLSADLVERVLGDNARRLFRVPDTIPAGPRARPKAGRPLHRALASAPERRVEHAQAFARRLAARTRARGRRRPRHRASR